MKLSAGQMNEFFERGYIVIKKMFIASEIEKMAAAADSLYNASKDLNLQTQVHKGSQFVFENNALHRVVWAGAHENDLLQFGADQRLLYPVSQLLGSLEMDQLINQVHFKMPGDDIEFEWHQDSQHRGYGTEDWKDLNNKGSYVQTLIAIDEVTKDKGPVKFIPETNKWGHIALDKIANKDAALPIHRSEIVLMQPGDVAMFSPYVVHASTKNITNTPRRVLINGYAYPEANKRQYPGEGSGRRVRAMELFEAEISAKNV